MAADPDSALLVRARAGDFAAVEEIVARHERRLYALALRILRRPEDAEDAVQTALVQALEGLGGFRGDAPLGSWLARITTHAALKVLRRRRAPGGAAWVAGGTGGGDESEGPLPRPEFIASWRDDPVATVERRELRALLDAAVDELPEGKRLVFLLRDVGGLSVEETADALGLTPANVKVRLLRARLALRERLTRVLGDPASRVAPHAHEDGAGDDGHGHTTTARAPALAAPASGQGGRP